MASLQDFINANSGHGLDHDGWYGDQCVDLVQYWCDANGWPIFSGNAIDIFGQHPDVFDWVRNTPEGVAQPGDILVWGRNASIGTGDAGHTAVFVSGDEHTFKSFDQNWPTGSVCRVIQHDYRGLVGWGHPKGAQQASNQGTTTVYVEQAQIDAWLHGPDGIDHWKSQSAAQADQIVALTKQVDDLKTQLQSQQTVIDDLHKLSQVTPAPAPQPVETVPTVGGGKTVPVPPQPGLRALKELARLSLGAAGVTALDTLRAGGKVDFRLLGGAMALAAYKAASTYVSSHPDIPLKGLFPF